MLPKLTYNFQMGLEAIFQNKLRGFLTSLGIIFGVASVITMMAIGRGAQEAVMEQLKVLGTNNIIIKPKEEQFEEDLGSSEGEGKENQDRYSPGLTLADADAIQYIIPQIDKVSPEIEMETTVLRSGLKRTGKLVGVSPIYFQFSDFELSEGNLFTGKQNYDAAPVCVIGSSIKSKFFPKENPIGKRIKCGKLWLTVVGVLKNRNISGNSLESLGLRDFNLDIYTPVRTILLRFKDRSRLTSRDIMEYDEEEEEESAELRKSPNYHQLDKLTVQISDTKYMLSAADVITRMLERRHNEKVDFEVIVPEQLLKQKQETNRIFNNVLFCIALISLLVGGIGIMNIMLASVMERIKEIGVRLAIGATKRDIRIQFLSEATALSISGGLLGIFTGFLFCYAIEQFTDIITIVTPVSVILSFFVAFAIGIIFGIFPAHRAAEADPVVSLRYQ